MVNFQFIVIHFTYIVISIQFFPDVQLYKKKKFYLILLIKLFETLLQFTLS